MRRADFAYDLPEDLIAQRPPIERSGSRLPHLERASARRPAFASARPEDLMAQRPPIERSGSRLLHLERATARLRDLRFTDLPSLLRAGDLLVFNDTRVIPARVVGSKPTGGQVEILLERVLEGRRILAHAHASKPSRSDAPVALPGGVYAHYIGRRDDLFELELSTDPLPYFEQHGSMPLPPYIEREAEAEDAARDQNRDWRGRRVCDDA